MRISWVAPAVHNSKNNAGWRRRARRRHRYRCSVGTKEHVVGNSSWWTRCIRGHRRRYRSVYRRGTPMAARCTPLPTPPPPLNATTTRPFWAPHPPSPPKGSTAHLPPWPLAGHRSRYRDASPLSPSGARSTPPGCLPCTSRLLCRTPLASASSRCATAPPSRETSPGATP